MVESRLDGSNVRVTEQRTRAGQTTDQPVARVTAPKSRDFSMRFDPGLAPGCLFLDRGPREARMQQR